MQLRGWITDESHSAPRACSSPWELKCHFLHFGILSRDTSEVVAN